MTHLDPISIGQCTGEGVRGALRAEGVHLPEGGHFGGERVRVCHVVDLCAEGIRGAAGGGSRGSAAGLGAEWIRGCGGGSGSSVVELGGERVGLGCPAGSAAEGVGGPKRVSWRELGSGVLLEEGVRGKWVAALERVPAKGIWDDM